MKLQLSHLEAEHLAIKLSYFSKAIKNAHCLRTTHVWLNRQLIFGLFVKQVSRTRINSLSLIYKRVEYIICMCLCLKPFQAYMSHFQLSQACSFTLLYFPPLLFVDVCAQCCFTVRAELIKATNMWIENQITIRKVCVLVYGSL